MRPRIPSAATLTVVEIVVLAPLGERPRLAAVLPIAWFALLTAAMTIAAAAVGPAPCPA